MLDLHGIGATAPEHRNRGGVCGAGNLPERLAEGPPHSEKMCPRNSAGVTRWAFIPLSRRKPGFESPWGRQDFRHFRHLPRT
jgi:hypothetical protein